MADTLKAHSVGVPPSRTVEDRFANGHSEARTNCVRSLGFRHPFSQLFWGLAAVGCSLAAAGCVRHAAHGEGKARRRVVGLRGAPGVNRLALGASSPSLYSGEY